MDSSTADPFGPRFAKAHPNPSHDLPASGWPCRVDQQGTHDGFLTQGLLGMKNGKIVHTDCW